MTIGMYGTPFAILVALYGEFILYDPPFRPATLLLWLGPPVFLGLALALLIRNLRRRTSGISESQEN